ncbi:MAG: BolA family protein, partial [Albidovulum sp.]|uniref:BolA family protein n=1 Tax=Albidovulum sp. TaxID=1872424 RepID=UPI003CAC89B7
ESERYRGHGGYREGGESHFRIVIRSSSFAGMSRIERHRTIHRTIGPDIPGRIHALAMDVEV